MVGRALPTNLWVFLSLQAKRGVNASEMVCALSSIAHLQLCIPLPLS